MSEGLPHIEIKKVTISLFADGWYIAFSYEQEQPEINLFRVDYVGVDLGINALAGKLPNIRGIRVASWQKNTL
ncbi:MAG: hypothetical protein ACHBN1_05470 [Heteroscytonema crispum UTEX LB 1556]